MAANVSEITMARKKKLDEQLSYLPPKLLDRLMTFQKEGVLFALNHDGRCLIGDEMGLGKTLQALSAAYYYKEHWPLLIVVPSSLRYPWIDEIERWFPEIDPLDINLIQAGTDIADISKARITVVTYGLLRCPTSTVLQEALLNQEFKVLIADESHYLKNRRSQTSKYLVPLIQAASHKFLLTGTPALARPEELFPQVDAICKGKFGTWSQYAKKFCDARWQFFGRQRKRWVTDGASNLVELESLLRYHCMIRRLKKDVLIQLPPKQRQRISFPLKDSTLKKDLDQTWKELDAAMGHGTGMNTLLNGAQQGTNGEAQDTGTFEIHRLISTVYRKTAAVKIGPVKEYVKMLCDNQGLKFLIFAHHHVMMDAISEQLHDDKIAFIRIDGNTDQQERPHLVQRFQCDESIRVAVLSIKAAGVGLTLTAARLVVFAELDWTPGVLEQCEDRAHRIGQKGTVNIHYLVAKGTMDEWVWSALARKTTVVSTTLNGKRQVLQMDSGHKGQVDCLANAEAWIPKKKEDNDEQDISSFFASQQPKNQRSLLEYFNPKGKKRKKCSKSEEDSPQQSPRSLAKKSKDETCFEGSGEESSPKQDTLGEEIQIDNLIFVKMKSKQHEDVIMVDSDSDDDFKKSSQSQIKSTLKTPDALSAARARQSTPNSRPKLKKRKILLEKDGGMEGKRRKSKWSCSQCTFLNHHTLPFCEMCSSAKTTNSSQQALMIEESENEPSQTNRSMTHESCDEEKKESKNKDISESQNETLTGNDFQSHLPDLDLDELPDLHCSPIPSVSNCRDSLKDKYSESPKSRKEGSKSKAKSKNASKAKGITDSEPRIKQNVKKKRDSADDFTGLWSLSLDMLDSDFEDESPKKPSTNRRKHEDHTLPGDVEEDSMSEDLFSEKISDGQSNCDDTDFQIDDFSDSEPTESETTEMDPPGEMDISMEPTQANNEPSVKGSSQQSKLNKSVEEMVQEEMEAAELVFGSEVKTGSGKGPWSCSECGLENQASEVDCEGCLTSRPKDNQDNQGTSAVAEQREVNLDDVSTYERFQYGCSKNTTRIYLFDEVGVPLDVNFLPLDVELENYSALPDLLLHPHNLRLIKRFVREWNSLAITKRRVIVKSGEVFANPLLTYENIRMGRLQPSRQRFTSKADVAAAAISKATAVNGTLRVVKPSSIPSKAASTCTSPIKKNTQNSTQRKSPRKKKTIPQPTGGTAAPLDVTGTAATSSGLSQNNDSSSAKKRKRTPEKPPVQHEAVSLPQTTEEFEKLGGLIQAVDADGRPLCVTCQKPYQNQLVSVATVRDNPWLTRFCSQSCAEQLWTRRHGTYTKKLVFELEHGVCQMCGFDAQDFFRRISITRDHGRRAELIQESLYSRLKPEIKAKMVRNPHKGQFWQVDHITAVADGGGECDIDNLRTLCTCCHRDVTAQQNKERAAMRRQPKPSSSKKIRNIRDFFQPT